VADLDDETVQSLARHCGLALTPAQVAEQRERLAPLVAHLETLAAVDVRDVPAWIAPGSASGLRDDIPGASLPAEVALAGASSRRGEYVAVPRSPRR